MKKVTINQVNQDQSEPKKKKIFLIVGRTSSGKTEMTRAVCEELGLQQVMSFTTRPMRDNEKKSLTERDHYFITPAEIDHYRDEIAAYTKIGSYEYFTTYEELDRGNCYVVDPNGVKDLKERCGDRYNFITIYIRRPRAEMMKSYNSRSQKGESFRERYDAEDEEFTAYEKANDWDYHILNTGDLNEAVSKLQRIITKEILKIE